MLVVHAASLCKYHLIAPIGTLVVAKKGANKGTKPSKADLPTKICQTCGRPFTWCVGRQESLTRPLHMRP